MNSTPRSPARLIGAIALLALAAGLLVAVWQWRPPRQLVPLPNPGGEGVIQEALGQLDSAAIKSRWVEEVSGLDLSGLPPARREVFLRFANAARCTCGCGYTLAGCRASDMECDVSGPALEALLDSVRAGWITTAAGIRSRPRAP